MSDYTGPELNDDGSVNVSPTGAPDDDRQFVVRGRSTGRGAIVSRDEPDESNVTGHIVTERAMMPDDPERFELRGNQWVEIDYTEPE